MWDPIKTFCSNSLFWVRHMKIGLRSGSPRDFPRSQPLQSADSYLVPGPRREDIRYEGIGYTIVQLRGRYCSGPMKPD
jgi:hypothetical protein